MTGTAITEAEEFFDIYKLNVTFQYLQIKKWSEKILMILYIDLRKKNIMLY